MCIRINKYKVFMHIFCMKIRKDFLSSEEQKTLETDQRRVLQCGTDPKSSKMKLIIELL